MVRGRNHGLLIAGGGVSASLAALAMARVRPEVPMLLVPEAEGLGGTRTLLLFDEGLSDAERELVAPLIAETWDSIYTAFPGKSRKLKLTCHAITPERIEQAVREALKPEQIRVEDKIVAVRDTSLLLHGGETILGHGAVDARLWAHQTTLDLGWRRSFGRVCDFAAPHRVDRPVLVDATLAAGKLCGFFALTPFGEKRLLVERVEYGPGSEVDAAAAETAVADYVAARGWKGGTAVCEESAAVPVALGGDFAAYWRIGGARVAKLGARGGFFHPTTGSPLPDAIRTALLLTEQRDFTGPALHDLFEAEAASLWKRREFYRGFNRHLLRDGRGCAPLAGLYELDSAVIARFEAEQLGMFERRKVMAAAEG
ncbi:MAG TPA: lycopene beta-cyclase CrtY [Allosphingosinicella sp.]|jgi:lycopene beta-cyclase|nr:lycopene beta-cyclase CrtY [Allosphingosinicella sp.]